MYMYTRYIPTFSLYVSLSLSTSSPSLKLSHLINTVQLHLHHQSHNQTMLQKRPKFFLNDHTDILIEILKRLDGRSLCIAACVCRLWCNIARNDSLWEELCFRHVSSPPPSSVRPVVVALGGYKRLYMVCLRPVLSRLAEQTRQRRVKSVMWSLEEVQLSLSLFCVDYYERLGVEDRLDECDASTSSLMFLCKPVNV